MALRSTIWPSEFGQPVKEGQAMRRHEDTILRNNFPVTTERLNPIKNTEVFELSWLFHSTVDFDTFSTFEGWYRHNLLRGVRGCTMILTIGGTSRVFTVFFNRGYTATLTDYTTALWSVKATVDVVEHGGY